MAQNTGSVLSVQGSVVDIYFEKNLPPIYQKLTAPVDLGDRQYLAVIEVQDHLDDNTIRGVAVTSTQGLARGDIVTDTGDALKMPVGKSVMGRMLNVLGETIDGDDTPLTDVKWKPIHAKPLPLTKRATKSEIFFTGIKLVDLLMPLERGGKAGLFGGAGCGKTVILTEMINNMFGKYDGLGLFCGVGERSREG
ncbi:MAG: F0F1 ATP synthase subunit beta, partial [Alphaproteobacteria bacterium]|nr:F0F1 ATP synthase subunit beta [Alphaproteobacteria bacterium]